MMMLSGTAWAIKVLKDDGWDMWDKGVYNTRKAARKDVKKTRADGWKSVRVVRVQISIEEIPPIPRPRTCVECGVNYADHPSDICVGCHAYNERYA